MDYNFTQNNIEESIQRTRQVMEESKALALKNFQRKNMLQEKFLIEKIEPEKDSSLNGSEIIRKVSELDVKSFENSYKQSEDLLKIDELEQEISDLRQLVKNQSVKIQELENNLNGIIFDKNELLKDLAMLKSQYLARLNSSPEKKEKNKKFKQNIEERISMLEEKYKQQVMANYELIENIKQLKNGGKNIKNYKIDILEEILIESVQKYKLLKERLDKTELLIAGENKNVFTAEHTPSRSSKLSSPKSSTKKLKKKKISLKISASKADKAKKNSTKMLS